MNPADYNILDLIPQRPPMVMIDRLVQADERSARGVLFVKDSNLFCHQGFLQESGLIECIAQTAAAFTGYRNRISNQEVKKGFIGAVKNLVIHALPAVNTEIQSEIIVETELLGYTIITGRISDKEKKMAECEMRILLEGNPS